MGVIAISVKYFLLLSAVVTVSIGYELPDELLVYDDPFDVETVNAYIANITGVPGNKYLVKSNCRRECVAGEYKICYQHFALEFYTAMGPACGGCSIGVKSDCFNPQCCPADGIERGIMTANRQMPGPAIEVCKGDRIIVDVTNNMAGTAATIHWHGILQNGTQYMDGVPYVTQCPIQSGTTFRYMFVAANAGTHFWHAHTGSHKANGLYGPLIVREPAADDRNSKLYDFDNHTSVFTDWTHVIEENTNPGLPTTPPNFRPVTFLVDGQGRWNNTSTGQRTNTTYKVYNIKSGYRYRFRLINSGNNACGLQFHIENHNLTIISTDGDHCEPKVVDTIVSYSGQRFDFIVNGNYPNGTYWMHFKGLGVCILPQIYQVALLSYNQPDGTLHTAEPINFPAYSQYADGVVLNHPDSSVNDTNRLKITDLRSYSYDQDESILTSDPDVRICAGFGNTNVDFNFIYYGSEWHHYLNPVGNILLVAAVNNISSTFPASPYLSQPQDVDESTLCNESDRPAKCANETICNCNHFIKVPLNSLVEMTLIDNDAQGVINHPFHLHGFKMNIVEVGETYNGVKLKKSVCDTWNRTNSRATSTVKQDTIAVPNSGYVTVRFVADNAGMWIIHCHIEHHLAIGMSMVMQVGDVEDYPMTPRDFPKCGNYIL